MRLLPLLALLSSVAGYRYVVRGTWYVVFPMPCASHSFLGRGIVSALVEAGHEVTHITALPVADPPVGVQQINASFMFDLLRKMPNFFKRARTYSFDQVKVIGHKMSTHLLQHRTIQKFMLDESQQFDAVITEWFFTDLYGGFSQVFQCPWLEFSPLGMTSGLEYAIDELQSPATHPSLVIGFTTPMSLVERIINSVYVLGGLFHTIYFEHPAQEVAYQQLFGPAAVARGVQLLDYYQLVHSAAVVFLNSHPALAQPLRLPPNAVEIGGFHITGEPKPLPEDLQQLMNDSQNGVVYFSMGSNLKSKDMPESMRSELLQMFGRLPYTVLWKFEDEMKAPENVHVKPWMPQQSILAHKNLKIFITHGGLLSTTEAVHYAVPVIVLPVYGDQFVNAMRAERNGLGLTVELNDANLAANLEAAIVRMIADSRYQDRAKCLSQLLRDRPVSTSRLISYWSEYAVRTRGALHLRSAAHAVPAYQRYLVDVCAVLAAGILLVAWMLRTLCGLVFTRTSSVVRTSSKKKKS